MKKIFVLLMISVLLISCSMNMNKPNESNDADEYLNYPFTGKTTKEPTFNPEVLVGSYILRDGYYGGSGLIGGTDYFIVSLDADGTFVIAPICDSMMGTAINKETYTGTWSIKDDDMTINYAKVSYTGSKEKLINTTNGELGGFAIAKTNYNCLFFSKVSDETFTEASVHGDISGLWGRSDEYGRIRGYRFINNGTCYTYTASGGSAKSTYLKSENSIKLNNEIFDYNYAIVGDYLFLGVVPYQRIK